MTLSFIGSRTTCDVWMCSTDQKKYSSNSRWYVFPGVDKKSLNTIRNVTFEHVIIIIIICLTWQMYTFQMMSVWSIVTDSYFNLAATVQTAHITHHCECLKRHLTHHDREFDMASRMFFDLKLIQQKQRNNDSIWLAPWQLTECHDKRKIACWYLGLSNDETVHHTVVIIIISNVNNLSYVLLCNNFRDTVY